MPACPLALWQVRLFEAAAAQTPSDAELHMALGVLHHLGRNFDGAVSAFERSLQLRPQDYSLWNKVGRDGGGVVEWSGGEGGTH